MHTCSKLAAVAAALFLLAGCGSDKGSSPAQVIKHRPLVTVPRVKDASIAKGERLVRQAGLVWTPMYAGSAGAPEIVTTDEVVLSQGPAAGKRVPRGTPVAVAIGVRPSTVAKVRRSRH